MFTCEFVISWYGKCGKPGNPCKKHANLKCCVCGNLAKYDCSVAGSITCGQPLCSERCETIHIRNHYEPLYDI